jgi:hypothetical protein
MHTMGEMTKLKFWACQNILRHERVQNFHLATRLQLKLLRWLAEPHTVFD